MKTYVRNISYEESHSIRRILKTGMAFLDKSQRLVLGELDLKISEFFKKSAEKKEKQALKAQEKNQKSHNPLPELLLPWTEEEKKKTKFEITHTELTCLGDAFAGLIGSDEFNSDDIFTILKLSADDTLILMLYLRKICKIEDIKLADMPEDDLVLTPQELKTKGKSKEK